MSFRFLDDVDTQKLLDVDRVTFVELLRSGRLRPVSSQGSIQFFRAGDVAKLRAELHPEPSAPTDETPPEPTPTAEGTPRAKKTKAQDPAMRVHQRLTADLKWYDISDDDLRAWVAQLDPEGYSRRRTHATFLIERMQHIIALLDENEARLSAPPHDN